MAGQVTILRGRTNTPKPHEIVLRCDMFTAGSVREAVLECEGNSTPPIVMPLVRTLRCFRACLLGLFVVAQVAGVVPLMYDHTLNVYETAPVAAHGHLPVDPTVANPDADHRHGLLDLHDQCCALHSLAGPIPHVLDARAAHFTSVRIVPTEVIAVTGGKPGLPDRPPKPVSLI